MDESPDLKLIIRRAGKLQRQCARYLGVPEPTFSRWVHNPRTMPMEYAASLSGFLGVPVADIHALIPTPESVGKHLTQTQKA